MKILYITQLLPYPLDTGGKIKTFKTLKTLSTKHQLYLVCFVPKKEQLKYQKKLEKFCQQVKVFVWPLVTAQYKQILTKVFLNFFSLTPFIFYRYQNPAMEKYVDQLIEQEKFDAVHIDHLNMAQYLPRKKNCPWILEEHNIESQGKWSIAKTEKFPFNLIFAWEAARLWLMEKKWLPRFEYILAISPQDKQTMIDKGVDKEKVLVLPTPMRTNNVYQWGKKNLLFIGLLSWWPNKDALSWFIKNIYSQLKKRIENLKLYIIGDQAKPGLRQLAEKDQLIILTGYQKEVTAYLKKAGCFILPFRMGSGIRIKMLTAMAAGIPVVGTQKGFEGLIGRQKEGLLVANEEKGMVKAIVEVLTNKRFALRVAKQQLNLIKKYYSHKEQLKVLNKIYENQQLAFDLKRRVFFDDLPIDKVERSTIVSRLKKLVEEKGRKMKTVVCLNANDVNWSYHDKQHCCFVKQADLVIPDGWGVVWAGKLLGYQLKERVTTADYFGEFCQMLADNNYSVYLLGGRESVIKKTTNILKKRIPNLKIVGFHHGFFKNQEEKKIIMEINEKQPDFLVLGMGTPKQEKWLYQNKDRLKVKVAWGVGAMFDYVAGVKKRCPVWLGERGLEWLFRLISEPRRLGKRYVLGSFEFVVRCWKIYFKER